MKVFRYRRRDFLPERVLLHEDARVIFLPKCGFCGRVAPKCGCGKPKIRPMVG